MKTLLGQHQFRVILAGRERDALIGRRIADPFAFGPQPLGGRRGGLDRRGRVSTFHNGGKHYPFSHFVLSTAIAWRSERSFFAIWTTRTVAMDTAE